MLEQRIFSRFPNDSSITLSESAALLLEQQKKTWQMLSDGIKALDDVQFRELHCNGFDITIQFNPKRIVSTDAKTDLASIQQRKCFLSVENLPDEQKAVLYRDTFLVLCNPMPIFRQHYTISHVDHIPQSIEESILTFLSLAKDLSPSLTVFYNGPKCGASAPDHMHFQASTAGKIPVERDVSDQQRREFKKKIAGVSIYTLKNYGRSVIILEGNVKQEMELTFLRLTAAMRKVLNTNDEPLINVLGTYINGMWRIIVFPRTKHRPDVYFKEGSEKILISPASVDIGGLMITPVEKDFHSMDIILMESILREVSIDNGTINSIIGKL